MYPISVYFGMFIQFQTTIESTIHLPAEGLDEGSDVDFFSLKGSTLNLWPFGYVSG